MALASLSVHAKKDECLVDLVELRAPLVEASLWGNQHLPRLDIGIAIKMATQFVAQPIPLEALRTSNHEDEVARFLEEMAVAHAAFGIQGANAKPPEYMRARVERLFEVERQSTIELLHVLIAVSGRDAKVTDLDDFFLQEKWPKNLAVAKRLTAVFAAYLETDDFRKLGRELREGIQARTRAGRTTDDILDNTEDRFEAQVTAFTHERDPNLLPTLEKFWQMIHELE